MCWRKSPAAEALDPGLGHALERAVVQHDVSGALRRQRRVREVARDRDGRLRVLALAQVVPDRVALVGAERVLEPVEELRRLHLLAAALAEQLALDRVQRDHVQDAPGLGALVPAVLLAVVGVDPLDVHPHVVDQPPAGLAVPPLEDRDLLGELALGLRARLEALQGHDQPDRAEAGCVDDGDARVVAGLLEQQLAVLGHGPAGAPGHVVIRPAVDVRDVELVAEDAQAVMRHPLTPHPALALDAELLGLEVAGEVARLHAVEEGRQPVVHARLLIRLRRRRHGAVLAGRDDVERGAGEIAHGERRRCGNKKGHHGQ